MKKIFFYSLFIALLYGTACNNNSSTNETATTITPTNNSFSLEKNGLKLTPVQSPVFLEAKLDLKSPSKNTALAVGTNNFEFEVQGYDLGNQTPDATQKSCANSAKGQHIHFIVNNEPYNAFYTNKFERDLSEGNNVVLAFLSRSYHESIKHKNAYVLEQFEVGKTDKNAQIDVNAPHLFYSRPKGNYIGAANIEKLLLDFYLVNTTLAPNGNKVKATINGTSFLLSKWQPYFIEGLKEGAVTIDLELVDKDGKTIVGPFNKVSRTVNLYKEEPMIDKK